MAFRRATSHFPFAAPSMENQVLKKDAGVVQAARKPVLGGGLRVRDTNLAPIEGGKKKAAAAAAVAAVPLLVAPLPALPVLPSAGLLQALGGAPAVDDGECPLMDMADDVAVPPGVTNIDLDDAENPQLAAEYVTEIFAYMRELEVRQAPSPTYMEDVQKDLRLDMRAILIDWLVEVHQRFKLIQETLYLTVHILDRYLGVQPVSRSRLQLVGVCSMLIASKYEEMFPPEVNDFVWVARNAYTRAEIVSTEGLILRALDFNLGTPLPLHFLRRNSRAAGSDPDVHHTAKYIMEVGFSTYALLRFPPSLVSAGSLYVARQVMQAAPTWDATMAHYAGYTEDELLPCVTALHAALPTAAKILPAVFKKFGDKKLKNASGRDEMVAFVAQLQH